MTSYAERQAQQPFSPGCIAVLLVLGLVGTAVRACTDWVGLTEPAPDAAGAAQDAQDAQDAQEARDARDSQDAHGTPAATSPPPGEAAPVDSHCGSEQAAAPAFVESGAWPSYRCLDRFAAGARWPACLRRADYTSRTGAGCPGAPGSMAEQRCCPAHDEGR